ncbi:cobalamin biosynthesis protein [Hymenobacter jejuensis]|uniref:Cobalamin biosynthesis protein n=1 Tax=Hymenobacter jejuensis TaxID=2502781 RepID=A0A5B7ZYT1_9BACT|nr:cobalamin biosynthesis protein [Hymenobacter jejuensis]QDA59656.1 cobalamin biosynthesis protein [Hymenobacter jejuensis]
METFLLANRWLHITAGFIGFFVAPVALLVRKGGPAHRMWGKVFFWAMVVAGSSAIVAASLKGMTFLLLTGVFSLYLAWFGYRSLYLKRLGEGQQPAWYDWVVLALGGLIFAGTVSYGLLGRNVVSLLFGSIGLMLVVRQLRGYLRKGPWPTGQWLLNHMSGFVGSYVAAVSAFSATSLKFIPFPINFLWPTFVMIPLLMWAQRSYRQKFKQGQRPTEVVEVRIGTAEPILG